GGRGPTQPRARAPAAASRRGTARGPRRQPARVGLVPAARAGRGRPDVTVQVARRLPWQPESTRLAQRGRLIVRLAEGAAGEHVPEHGDVRAGARTLAFHLDGDR